MGYLGPDKHGEPELGDIAMPTTHEDWIPSATMRDVIGAWCVAILFIALVLVLVYASFGPGAAFGFIAGVHAAGSLDVAFVLLCHGLLSPNGSR